MASLVLVSLAKGDGDTGSESHTTYNMYDVVFGIT